MSSPTSIADSDSSTIYTPSSTSEGRTILMENDSIPQSSVPWPGSTFIIESQESGKVITLLKGQIVLASPGGPGTYRWQCVETKGWLGFRDPGSYLHIGYDNAGILTCIAGVHNEWEWISLRHRPEGGYYMLMTFWKDLRRIGIRNDSGHDRLGKVEDHQQATVWKFTKVECAMN